MVLLRILRALPHLFEAALLTLLLRLHLLLCPIWLWLRLRWPLHLALMALLHFGLKSPVIRVGLAASGFQFGEGQISWLVR